MDRARVPEVSARLIGLILVLSDSNRDFCSLALIRHVSDSYYREYLRLREIVAYRRCQWYHATADSWNTYDTDLEDVQHVLPKVSRRWAAFTKNTSGKF
jgi:hypothetical protein